MKKKIFMSLFTIGIVGAMMTGGAIAYFSDTEVSTNNTFTAGTIDISIDPASGQEVVTLEGDLDLKPSQTGYTYTSITNDGTNPCEVWKHIANVENREHGIADAEAKYYAAHPGSESYLMSNWIHYDLLAFRSLGYSWSGEVETLEGEIITVEVEDGGSTVTWTIDYPIDADPGNGKMAPALVIALDGDGQGPAYQIHNNDGACSAYDWGTWLYSPWDTTMGGYHGWHSGDPDWNTPVADLDWVSCTGDRDHDDNPTGEFTISIDKCKLVPDFHWALFTVIGTGFWDFDTQYLTTPPGHNWMWDEPIVNMSEPNYEYANLAEQTQEILESAGFFLTGNDGVESHYVYLGVLEPSETLIVIQSYHLDADVENWAQSDRVFFDMEFLAQQTEGTPPPSAPTPELSGYGRP